MSALSYWQQLDLLVSQWKEQQRIGDSQQRNLPLKGKMKANLTRTPMTLTETLLVDKLQRNVRFPPGTSHKRFIGGLKIESLLSDRGRQYLAYIAHRYRRQWKPTEEEFEWMVRWGAMIQLPKERN